MVYMYMYTVKYKFKKICLNPVTVNGLIFAKTHCIIVGSITRGQNRVLNYIF